MTRTLEMFDHDIEVSDEFAEWFDEHGDSDWHATYSGDLYKQWIAWEAGRKFGESKRD